MKYFYTDPLAAIWMAKHFEMKMYTVNAFHDDIPFRDIHCCYKPYGVTYDNIINAKSDFEQFYIHPDSLHLLEPQIGDMVLDEDGINGINIELPIQLEQCRDSQIIMRGDIAFMMPESEGQ